jgi:hypothetical protein
MVIAVFAEMENLQRFKLYIPKSQNHTISSNHENLSTGTFEVFR